MSLVVNCQYGHIIKHAMYSSEVSVTKLLDKSKSVDSGKTGLRTSGYPILIIIEEEKNWQCINFRKNFFL